MYGLDFWRALLADLGYDVDERRVVVDGVGDVSIMYDDGVVEVAVIMYDKIPSKFVCGGVVRDWERVRGRKPLLIFTDGGEAYVAVLRHGIVWVLHLGPRLYVMDFKMLESLRRPKGGVPPYDSFLLYERIRDDFVEKCKVIYSGLVRELGDARLARIVLCDKIFKGIEEGGMDLFKEYRFVKDEPYDVVEIGVDPSMVATVFENMISDVERVTKGVFYTDFIEVVFICRRALATWLGLNDRVEGDRFVDGLKEYVEGLKLRRDASEIEEFKRKLLSAKVCDPAVGCGGFLINMLHLISSLIMEVDKVVGVVRGVSDYKEQIIRNLYGFDIDGDAVNIAKRRLWMVSCGRVGLDDIRMLKVGDSLIIPELEAKGKGVPLEYLLPEKPDIIVMNPPYVRSERIREADKQYYIRVYGLDTSSDLYAYFILRALHLLKRGGVASIIVSDKWMETRYGMRVQEKIRPYLVGVYCQKERSFDAGINTVIVVLNKRENGGGSDEHQILFLNMRDYGSDIILNAHSLPQSGVESGKWNYLRLSNFFEQVLHPRMPYVFTKFAYISGGVHTGANKFFILKDVSHMYDGDWFTKYHRLSKIGIRARTSKELEEQGLVYVENGFGERFVIDRKDVAPILKTPKQIQRYVFAGKTSTLVLCTDDAGEYTKLYIEWGERRGIHMRPTFANRRPWYAIPERMTANIIVPLFWRTLIYTPLCIEKMVCNSTMRSVIPRSGVSVRQLWLYMNSTIFYVTVDLYSRRLPRGALEVPIVDYELLPAPNISKIIFPESINLDRPVLNYDEEVKQPDRRELDKAVLRAMGFGEEELEGILDKLYDVFVRLVEDRLSKSFVRGQRRDWRKKSVTKLAK